MSVSSRPVRWYSLRPRVSIRDGRGRVVSKLSGQTAAVRASGGWPAPACRADAAGSRPPARPRSAASRPPGCSMSSCRSMTPRRNTTPSSALTTSWPFGTRAAGQLALDLVGEGDVVERLTAAEAARLKVRRAIPTACDSARRARPTRGVRRAEPARAPGLGWCVCGGGRLSGQRSTRGGPRARRRPPPRRASKQAGEQRCPLGRGAGARGVGGWTERRGACAGRESWGPPVCHARRYALRRGRQPRMRSPRSRRGGTLCGVPV